MKRTTMLVAGALAGAVALAAGCGSDDDQAAEETTSTATNSTEPALTEPPSTEPAGTAAAPSRPPGSAADGGNPQRILSLSATATEMLFAIGAGGDVIAVDSLSNFPPEAEAVMTDLSAFEPNVEAIAGYAPDLVVTDGSIAGLTEQLEALGIDVSEGPAPATFEDSYAQIEQLGALTGRVGEAAELVASIQTDLEAIARSVPTSEVPLTYYHELDDLLYSATSSTFIGAVYSLFGLQNIADQVEAESGGYPQLNAEFIIEQDPDLIFLADTKCCQQSLETVGDRDGWADMRAVVAGNVFPMDDDVASRWGPRVVDYARAVADALEQALMPADGG